MLNYSCYLQHPELFRGKCFINSYRMNKRNQFGTCSIIRVASVPSQEGHIQQVDSEGSLGRPGLQTESAEYGMKWMRTGSEEGEKGKAKGLFLGTPTLRSR